MQKTKKRPLQREVMPKWVYALKNPEIQNFLMEEKNIKETMAKKKSEQILQSVQSLSHVRLFESPWTAARQASLSINNSQSLLKLMSIELVMTSNHLIHYCPLFLLPSIFASIRVFSNESVLCIRWPKYWSFSISPSNEYSGLIDWFDPLAVQATLKSLLKASPHIYSTNVWNVSSARHSVSSHNSHCFNSEFWRYGDGVYM